MTVLLYRLLMYLNLATIHEPQSVYHNCMVKPAVMNHDERNACLGPADNDMAVIKVCSFTSDLLAPYFYRHLSIFRQGPEAEIIHVPSLLDRPNNSIQAIHTEMRENRS